jgi:hypothetical protein
MVAKLFNKNKKVNDKAKLPLYQKILLGLCGLSTLPVTGPTIIVIVIGLLPSLSALASQEKRNHRSVICMASMNFAALFYWIVKMCFGSYDVTTALEYSLSLRFVLFSFSGAAIGWFMFQVIPPIYIVYKTNANGVLAKKLTEKRQKLVETWGDKIKDTIPLYVENTDA